MFSVAYVLMYLRIISNLEDMLMMWGGRDKLKFQQHDCHLVIRLSEYTGLPSGINYIHLLLHLDWKKKFQEKGENLLTFKYEIGIHEKPNNPVFYCCDMLLVASLMSICFTGNHRQYTLFEYIVKLCFVMLYSCVLLEINVLLLLLHMRALMKDYCL